MITISKQVGPFTMEASGDDLQEVFKSMGEVDEVLTAAQQCAACQGADIALRHRHNQGYDFYEAACKDPDCRAALKFGIRKQDGRLFPSRKDSNGNFLGKWGWVKYQPQSQQQGGPPQGPPSGTPPTHGGHF